ESKYVAVSGCCAQVLWMRTQLTDYGFFYDKVPIYCDQRVILQSRGIRTCILVTYFVRVVVTSPVSSEPALKKEIPRELLSISLPFLETEVAKCLVDKKYLEIKKKELSLDNDRLLEHIICQDVMNIVMHANDHHDNVFPANNNSLVYDNSVLDLLKPKNDQLMELLISQDFVHIAVNSLAAISDYKSMEQSFVDEYEWNLKLQTELDKKNDMIEKDI
nr:retrovirus-related Pol polyprotein from transposon TNT 1-94 [Tanacetum cinerariifolium]